MKNTPKLIVMLTHNDLTVPDAREIFEGCKDAAAEAWGFKEEPLPRREMAELFAYMKRCGKETFLEVVAYSEEEGLAGAETAYECGCDCLMGTLFYDSINDFCKKRGLRYMPFAGEVSGRPSVLSGSIDGMTAEANALLEKGVYGFDLLGYRYTGDAAELCRRFVAEVKAPVCIAGSINSFARLDEVKKAAPAAFTIGGAFFEGRFGSGFARQINDVCRYMKG
ncbi:MAG: hypothetical protein ILO36_05495 [Abditibacteriota bacterium]|nr:hypothetical protein [Abditibacteriota bacterium]